MCKKDKQGAVQGNAALASGKSGVQTSTDSMITEGPLRQKTKDNLVEETICASSSCQLHSKNHAV